MRGDPLLEERGIIASILVSHSSVRAFVMHRKACGTNQIHNVRWSLDLQHFLRPGFERKTQATGRSNGEALGVPHPTDHNASYQEYSPF